MAFSFLKRLGIVLLAVAAVNISANAADIPIKNAGFEVWNAEKNAPEAWYTQGKGYDVSQDCEPSLKPPEGKCALRIRDIPGAETSPFIPFTQILPATGIGGHPFKLSGYIRTENVSERGPALWLRIDGQDGRNKLDNMEGRRPQGTTPWQRFELTLPVAPESKSIVFGVMLAGKGTAWFDGLKLESDESVTIAPGVVAPVVVAPPRPVISQELLDDKALNLSAAVIPAVKEEWRDDIRKRHHAIRSLSSDDYSDLQFLKPLLKGKRVVQLGESSHGIAEFSWMKVRLIKFLHQEMGYDVIAFESNMTSCHGADRMIGVKAPDEVMRECIFSVWHSDEVLPLFKYMDFSRAAGKRVTLAGFDVQNSGASTQINERFKAFLAVAAPELAARVDANAKLVRRGAPATEVKDLVDFYGNIAEALKKNRTTLRTQFKDRPAEIDIAIQEANSRIVYVKQLSATDPQTGTAFRDRGMADNLDFLLDKVYPDRKVIVWAHNFHIAYQRSGLDTPVAMGSWVAERRKPEVYTVGLFMGCGVGAMNDRVLHEIKPPERDTLEAVFANGGQKMSFVDFSKVRPAKGNEWMFQETNAREWGQWPIKLTPASTFDGVLYIDNVTPPKYVVAPIPKP